MSPALIKTALKTKEGAKKAVQSETGKKAIKVASITAGAVAGFFIVRGFIRKTRKNNTEKKIENPEVQAAIKLRAAFQTWGWDFWGNIDGTDEEAVLNTLRSVSSFKNVADAYKKLYNQSLVERLEKELDGEELTEAFKIINSK